MSKGKARVLVIDDEIEIVRVLQRGLIVGGYTADRYQWGNGFRAP